MRIEYSIFKDKAEYTAVHNDGKDSLTLTFTPHADGYLTIGKEKYRVRSGRLEIPTRNIRNGSYAPVLEALTGTYTLDPFTKNGDSIEMLPTDEAALRRYFALYRDLDRRTETIEKRLAALESANEGHHIFK